MGKGGVSFEERQMRSQPWWDKRERTLSRWSYKSQKYRNKLTVFGEQNGLLCAKSLQSGPTLFVTLRTVACQAPLSMESSRQEYWSGLLCSPPGDLPNSGIKPAFLTSPALAGFFTTTLEVSTKWDQIGEQGLDHVKAFNTEKGHGFYSKYTDKPCRILSKGITMVSFIFRKDHF